MVAHPVIRGTPPLMSRPRSAARSARGALPSGGILRGGVA